MSSDLNFDRAEYVIPATETVTELAPGNELLGSSWNPAPSRPSLPKAIAAGFVAAILGSCVYAAFTLITHIEIGYLGLFLGFFIASAMMRQTGHAGGRPYQIAAAILTYLSISMAAVPEILYSLHSHGKDLSRLTLNSYLILAGYGIGSPVLELIDHFASGAIGLFIIFIAIRGAWKVAAGKIPSA
jgi:hypothetical protein